MNVVRKSFRTRKYQSLQEKENNQLLSTPEYVKRRPEIEDPVLDEEDSCSRCTKQTTTTNGREEEPTAQKARLGRRRIDNKEDEKERNSRRRGRESDHEASQARGSRRDPNDDGEKIKKQEQQQQKPYNRLPSRRTSMGPTTQATKYSAHNWNNKSFSHNSSGSVVGVTTTNRKGSSSRLSKSESVRLTVLDAVDTLRRKISSTAQLMSQGSLSTLSSNINARRRSMRLAASTPPPRCQHRHTKLDSPFEFATPEKRKTLRKWCDTETPTKLRREVEALTADMQALASLTPNTLRTRAAARRQNVVLSPNLRKTPSRRFESLI